MRHVRSPIALHTKPDAKCNQQATVVDRLLTALSTFTVAKHCQRQNDDCQLFITLRGGGHAVAKLSKSKVWDKVPEGSSLVFQDTLISVKHSVG